MTAKKDEKWGIAGLVLITCACLVFASCATSGPAKPSRSAASTYAPTILTAKTWYLSGFRTSTGFVPIQPGQGSAGLVTFKKDGSMEGTTGINQFTGTWTLRKEKAGSYSFTAKIRAATRHEAPNDIAARFDRDVVNLINRAETLKIEKDSITLENGQDGILLTFIHY